MAFGRYVFGTVGRSIQLTSDGRPKMKTGGVTIDWTTVAAVSGADVSLPDGIVAPIGTKYLRCGQALCLITATGSYGPYDSAASDGRQTPARGKVFLLNETVLQGDDNADSPPVLDGGRVWKARVLATTGTASLTAGPTFAVLEAAMPQISYTGDSV